MGFIVIFAFIAAVAVIAIRSYREAFLYIYVPILICIPAWPRWVLPGVPDPTFQQAAILPIAVAFFRSGRYRFSRFDYVVLGFLGITAIAELVNSGYPDAQNLLFDMVTSGMLPYMIAKGLMDRAANRVRLVKIFVLCTSAVIVTTMFEVKFAYNPYRLIFDMFFPGQGEGWVTTFRYGLPRVAGPYGHAILAGVMFLISIRLQSWLQISGNWHPKWKKVQIGSMRINAARALTFWNCLGLVLTWVRGPQIGALLAWVVFRVSRSEKPKLRLQQAAAALGVLCVPISVWFLAWIAGGRAAATTAGQESAAYRKELLEKYAAIVMHRAWLGWGLNGWPKVPSMPSIDNYYLLTGLRYGLPAVVLLIMIFVVLWIRLFKRGIEAAVSNPTGSSFSFTLMSIFAGLAFSFGTVYLGEGVFGVFFVLVGLSEAFLGQKTMQLAAKKAQRKVQRTVVNAKGMRFRRVVA